MKPPPKLPEWLNNTLATLPTDNAVRCLTLPPEPHKCLIRNDHIDWSPDAPDESSVFAFQAPVDGRPSHPADPAETEGSGLATFQIAHDEYVTFHGGTPAAPLALPLAASVPFSTPGPGRTSPQTSATRRPRRPSSALPMYRPTSAGTHRARDSPLPFSTPGPFAPARPANGYRLGSGLAAQLSAACDKALPITERTGATSVLSSRGDAAGPLSPFGTTPPANYFDPAIESTLSSTPEEAFYAEELAAAGSSGDLSRGPPAEVMQRLNARDAATHGKPTAFLSGIQLDQRPIHWVLLLIFLFFLKSISVCSGYRTLCSTLSI